MKLPEVAQKAVNENDPALAGELAGFLRFRIGLNYRGVFQFFNKATGISEPDFDALMYAADENEGIAP